MKKLLSVLALITLFTVGCSATQGNVILKINGEAITQKQFDDEFKEFTAGSPFFANADALKNTENNMLYGIFKDKVVNELIYKTLLNQEIARRNITVTNDDYANEIAKLSEILGSREELNNFLKNRGISPAKFKKATYERLKMEKLAESISKTNVTDDDVKRYYEKKIKSFTYPEKVRASHILVLADEKEYATELKKVNPEISESDLNARVKAEMAKRKAKAEEILKQVKANPDNFAKIAKEKSDDRTSAKMGGELGFFSHKEMVKPFSDAAFSLPVNKVSELVKTRYGYHIIIVTDRMEAGTYPFEKVKNEIEQTLRTTQQMQTINGLASSLKNSAKIEYVDERYGVSEFQKILDSTPIEEE